MLIRYLELSIFDNDIVGDLKRMTLNNLVFSEQKIVVSLIKFLFFMFNNEFYVLFKFHEDILNR